MKKKLLISLTSFILGIFISSALFAGGSWIELLKGYKGLKSPDNYGSILLTRYADKLSKMGMKPVVFPHWIHRAKFTCKVCHTDIGFTMKAGADDIKMGDIFKGEWCGRCHNGKIAFPPVKCIRCHSLGLDVPDNHKIADTLKDLPKDVMGNKINWVKALEGGAIVPKASLDGKEEMFIFDKNIDFKVKANFPRPPDVVYSHKVHTAWLQCGSCHPSVFNMKAGGNPKMSMSAILNGKYCGVCHGKVAFPLDDCFRCHSKKR